METGVCFFIIYCFDTERVICRCEWYVLVLSAQKKFLECYTWLPKCKCPHSTSKVNHNCQVWGNKPQQTELWTSVLHLPCALFPTENHMERCFIAHILHIWSYISKKACSQAYLLTGVFLLVCHGIRSLSSRNIACWCFFFILIQYQFSKSY